MVVPITGNVKLKSKKVIDVGEALPLAENNLSAEEIETPAYQFLVFNKLK